MRVLITGANGFVGKSLSARLVREMAIGGTAIESLKLADVRLAQSFADARVQMIEGSLTDDAVFARAFAEPLDLVFHMATIPGGRAEQNFDLGRQVNLELMIRLLEQLRQQPQRARLVYTSSIGVYSDFSQPVNDATPASPNWSYGAHKYIGELLLADYHRKGFIDGRTIRFSAIVARPTEPSGAISAFMSDLIRQLAAGQPFVCPVSAAAQAWWMSLPCAVDNLLHAATVSSEKLRATRSYMLPALRCSISEIVAAIERVYGVNAASLISYKPQPDIEDRFGKLPPIHLPAAESLGFRHDDNVDELVKRALT